MCIVSSHFGTTKKGESVTILNIVLRIEVTNKSQKTKIGDKKERKKKCNL